MRSTKIALFLLAAVILAVAANSIYVSGEIGELQELTRMLPGGRDALEQYAAGAQSVCDTLSERWEQLFPYLAYVCSYQELNRADESILELSAAVNAGNFDDAAAARAKLLDALRRLAQLEGLTFGAVF